VNDSWNDLGCIIWGDEVLEVPPISIPENSMGQKGEGDVGVEQSEENRQSMAENEYGEGEETNSTVVVTLEGKQWEHDGDTAHAKTTRS
jgi:hypothetical protein